MLLGCFRLFHVACLAEEYCVTCQKRRERDEAKPRHKAQGKVITQYEIDVNGEYKIKEWKRNRVQTPKLQLPKKIFHYRSCMM